MARRLPEASTTVDPLVHDVAGLGAVVRNARAHARLRIDDAAVFSGVSADTLSRLENGRPVSTDRLLKVLEGLGLSMLIVHRSQALKLKGLAQSEPE